MNTSIRLTNRLNLPEAIYEAVANDPYNKGEADFSITELLKPPRQRALQAKHKDEITEDVADRLWSLYGQIAHTILERSNKNDLVEKRFFVDVRDRTVSGQIDTLSIDGGVLSDFKFTSAWGFSGNKEAKPEHVQQLNMQAYLLSRNGYEAKELQIIALLRDWQISKAKIDKKYPQGPIIVQPIPKWTNSETLLFMETKISEHEHAFRELPECSSEETWKTRRCRDYCNVNTFCEQYQKTKEQQNGVWI